MSLNLDWITLNGSGETSVSRLGIGTTDPNHDLDVVGDAYVSGTVSAATLTGTLSTAAQPNITSVGTLTSLNVLGRIYAENSVIYANTFYVNDNGKTLQEGIDEMGTQQASVLEVSSGSYADSDILIQDKINIGIQAPIPGNMYITEIGSSSSARTLTITGANSTRVRMTGFQVKGLTTISGTQGRHYFHRMNFAGGLTLSGSTTNWITFNQCDFDGIVTIPNTFAGVIYFIQCAFGNKAINCSAPSSQQVILINCSGLTTLTSTSFTYLGQCFHSNGSSLLNNPGGMVSGTVSAATLTGTLSTAAQPNITSVGTLTSLNSGSIAVTGDIDYTGTLKQNGVAVSFGGSSVWSTSGTVAFYNSGNVGIGTNNPGKALDVMGEIRSTAVSSFYGARVTVFDPSQTGGHLGWGIAHGGFDRTDNSFAIIQNGIAPRLIINNSGYVGIGHTDPGFPLVVNGTQVINATSGKWFAYNVHFTDFNGNAGVSIMAQDTMWAQAFVASSDERIKKDISTVDDNQALSKLRLVEPKEYNYIDVVSKGTKRVFGFIAQQVREHFPEAVSVQRSFIPDVYSQCPAELHTRRLTFEGARAGKIRLITLKREMEIEVTNPEPGVVELPEATLVEEDLYEGKVFVYGYEVEDFHTLNKDYLFTINFAATQELDRKNQELETKNQELTLKVVSLESQLQSLRNALIDKGIIE